MHFFSKIGNRIPLFFNSGRTQRLSWAGPLGCRLAGGKKKKNTGLTMGPAGQNLKRTGTLVFVLDRARARYVPTARKNSVAAQLDEGGTGGNGEWQSGGGAPPLPPCTDGGSREALERRERVVLWEHVHSGELDGES
jgi:hypothetical protein